MLPEEITAGTAVTVELVPSKPRVRPQTTHPNNVIYIYGAALATPPPPPHQWVWVDSIVWFFWSPPLWPVVVVWFFWSPPPCGLWWWYGSSGPPPLWPVVVVCWYVGMLVCWYAGMYVCMYVCLCMYVCVCVCVCMYVWNVR